jgi:hypothetical protein
MALRLQAAGYAVVALVAALVYVNTLGAGFCFDDNFAVVRHIE